MKYALLIAVTGPLAMGVAFYAKADDSKSAAITSPIEQCIRDNAAKVEAAVPDLEKAVDFLVGKICAEPIARETARISGEQRLKYAASLKKSCDEEKAEQKNQTASQDTKKALDACAMTKIGFVSVDQYDADGEPAYAGVSPPAAIALASNLLLDLRLSHANAGHQK